MEKKYRRTVWRSQELKAMVSRGRAAVRILLLSDEAQGEGVMKDDIARPST